LFVFDFLYCRGGFFTYILELNEKVVVMFPAFHLKVITDAMEQSFLWIYLWVRRIKSHLCETLRSRARKHLSLFGRDFCVSEVFEADLVFGRFTEEEG
jgi:hypothetical protein